MKNPTAILRISPPHCLKQEFLTQQLSILVPIAKLKCKLKGFVIYYPPIYPVLKSVIFQTIYFLIRGHYFVFSSLFLYRHISATFK